MRQLSSPMKAWSGEQMAPKVLMGRTTKRIHAGTVLFTRIYEVWVKSQLAVYSSSYYY